MSGPRAGAADGDEVAGPSDSARARYYQGVVIRLFRGSRRGFVRSATGREIPFDFDLVRMVGPVRRADQLNEGMQIGFDVSRTQRGVCVSLIRCWAERAE